MNLFWGLVSVGPAEPALCAPAIMEWGAGKLPELCKGSFILLRSNSVNYLRHFSLLKQGHCFCYLNYFWCCPGCVWLPVGHSWACCRVALCREWIHKRVNNWIFRAEGGGFEAWRGGALQDLGNDSSAIVLVTLTAPGLEDCLTAGMAFSGAVHTCSLLSHSSLPHPIPSLVHWPCRTVGAH